MSKKTRWMGKIAIVAIILMATVSVGCGGCGKFQAELGDKAYYSVTLINNTGFFGHISAINGKELVMTDVYYLRRTPTAEDPQRLNISLVAKKDDVYSPTDKLMLNWDQILMYEKLADDSRIIELIQRAKAAPQAPAAPAGAPAPAPAAAAPAAPPPPPPAAPAQ